MYHWLRHWIRLYVFPSGRRMRAFQDVAEIAAKYTLSEILEMAQSGVLLEQKGRNLYAEWRTGIVVTSTAGGKPSTIDPIIDRLISGIVRTIKTVVRSLSDNHPTRILAQTFLATHFPDGTAALTALPYDEQLVATEELIKRLDQPEAKTAVETFGLGIYITELKTHLPQYRAEIIKQPPKVVTYGEVAAAMTEAQNHLLALVAAILGNFTDQPSIQAELLGPIAQQQEKIRQSIQSGKKPKDVVPETGEEIEGSDEEPLPPGTDGMADESIDNIPI